MTYTCPICEKKSKNTNGHEVWPQECGFYELARLGKNGHSGYSACSKQCAAKLLEKVALMTPEVKPFGIPSETCKCKQCRAVLPQNVHQSSGSESELMPTASYLVGPDTLENSFFCSDACLMAHLKSGCDEQNVIAGGDPKTLHPIVLHLLYGDIDEMPLSFLGSECPTQDSFQKMDEEQRIRFQVAATIQAWMDGKLHKKGFIHDPSRHADEQLVQRLQNHIAAMAPHQKDRVGGKLLIEAAAEIKRLSGAKEREAVANGSVLLDHAVNLLASWCVAIEDVGTGWDDWDEFYKDANCRPGPLRDLIDAAKAKVREQESPNAQPSATPNPEASHGS